jgi:transposase
MYYPISVGLDVHLNSISACAFNSETGEVAERKFAGGEEGKIAEWILSLDYKARAVYESGFCGFTLKRILDGLGVPCEIAAISKLAKPSGDKVKTDKRDAAFLARQLAAGNITRVHVPSIEREGMRDLSRALGIARASLTSAKLRVMQTHHRYGLRFEGGKAKGAWTLPWMSWAINLKMPSEGAQLAYDFHMAEALRLIDEKKRLERLVAARCEDGSIKGKVDALMSIKGISRTVAFCLVSEIGEFSRFQKGSGLSSFLGLVPSENSSGDRVSRGSITGTGNEHARNALIESSWCYSRMNTPYKKPVEGVAADIAASAHKANRRLLERSNALRKTKRPCVANAAIAREMACLVWRIAVMVEEGPGPAERAREGRG